MTQTTNCHAERREASSIHSEDSLQLLRRFLAFTRNDILIVCTSIACSSDTNAKHAGSDTRRHPCARSSVCRSCVSLSGIQIYGDAYTWWDKAAKQGYERGNVPKLNAVIVLKKSNRLSNGHVAMVRHITDSRHIEVTHANWGMEESHATVGA